MPLTAEMVFNEKDPVLAQLYEKEWRKGGHACVPYGEWKINKMKEDETELNERVLRAFDEIQKNFPLHPSKTSIKLPIKLPKMPIKEEHHRRIPLKSIIAIIILIIIGLYTYFNFDRVSEMMKNVFLLFGPTTNCKSDFVKAYESTASFGKDPSTYCQKTCIENYNSTEYKVVEPNETSKLTICYCNIKNCSVSKAVKPNIFSTVILKCNDGTPYNQCSSNKPFYCFNGTLIKNISSCGCPIDEVAQNDSCISKFIINPKEQNLNYILKGTSSSVKFTVYGGLNDYLAALPRYYYCEPSCPSDRELELRFLDQNKQKGYLTDLVNKIKSLTNNKDDQARIAISLVQKIPYDWEGFKTNNLKDRYPYEVIYDKMGVCAEKAHLLAFILRELGFGVVLFKYESESHMAVGLKCPSQYSYKNNGYCFVEAAAPSIITDEESDYVGVGKLYSTPETIAISDGVSFESVSEEYNDAKEWRMLYRLSDSMGGFLDAYNYYRWTSLVNKYGIELSGKSVVIS